MKLIKLSLAALMVLGTSSIANDSLSDAFKNGTFNGVLEAHYTAEDSRGTDDNITSFGVKLNYKTADFYGFNLSFGTQSSTTPWSNDQADKFFAAANSEAASGTVLSEAALSYKILKSTIKAGRQYINMPLMATSPSRLIHQSFEGVTLNSNDIKDTHIQAAYITKFQNRTDGQGDIANFEDFNGDYAYAVSASNKSIKNTKLTLAYGEQELSHSMAFAEAEYKNNDNSLRYGLAGQYTDVDYENSSKIDPSYYSVKASVGKGIFDFDVAMSEIQDNDAAFSVLGGGTKIRMYTSAFMEAGDHDESSQYSAQLSTTFKNIGLKIITKYINIDYEADNDEADVLVARVHYQIPNIHNLQFLGAFESWDHASNDEDTDEVWLRLKYTF